MKIFSKILVLITTFLICIPTVFSQDTDLTIDRTSPTGQTRYTSDYDAITVKFSEDMIAIESVKDVNTEYFDFNIPIKGQYRWLDTKTLGFFLEEKLPPMTSMEVTIKKGIKSLSGNELDEDYIWQFKTILPRINRYTPYNGSDNVSIKPDIVLEFNVAFDIQTVRNMVSITESERNVKYTIEKLTKDKKKEIDIYVSRAIFNEQSNEYDNVFVLTPTKSFQKDTEIEVAIIDFSNNNNVISRFSFETHKEIRYTGKINQSVTADFYPESPNIEFTTAIRATDFYKSIDIQPPVQMPTEDELSSYPRKSFSLRELKLNADTDYIITIKKGLKDVFEQELDKDVIVNLSIGAYNANVYIPSGNGIVEAYEGKKLPITAINPNPITVKSKHLTEEQIVPFIMLSRYKYSVDDNYKNTYKSLLEYNQTSTLEITTTTNQYEIVPLYLENYLEHDEKYGLLALAFETETGYEGNYDKEYNTYVQVTDLGITGKFSAESNTIFVTELKTGKPIQNAIVEIRDDNNIILDRTTTDKNGIAITKGWYTLGIKRGGRWETPRQWAIVKSNDDIAFINSDWGIGIDPWRMDISYDYYQNYPKYSGTMFTERGLYKPSEKVHIKGIVRENINGSWQVAKLFSQNVAYEIYDSRNKKIDSGRASVNEYGSFLIDTTIPSDSPTGYYSVRVEAESLSMSQSFRVEEFKPVEFESRIWVEDKGYVLNDDMPIRMSGWYLFGEPMTEKPVQYNITMRENFYNPPNNPGFRFTPLMWYGDDYYNQYSRAIAKGSATLDDKGEYFISPRISSDRDIHSAFINVEATVEGEDSQRVSSRKTILVHGSDFYFGIKRGGYFIEKDEPTTIEIIAADSEGNRLAGKEGKLKIVRTYWESVKKSLSGGRVKWYSEEIKETVAEIDITTKGTDENFEYMFTPEHTGQYTMSISGVDSQKRGVLAEEYMYVIGGGYSPWAMFDDDLLELIVEKDNYEPGETAKILAKSPYEEATAFITVEREYVLETYVTNVRGSSVIIHVPIKNEYLPNVYVGVTLIKGRVENQNYTNETEDLGKPSFKIGYAPISVSPKEKLLNVEITKSHEQREPGEAMSVDFKVTKQDGSPVESEIMVAVADIGVLNLIGYSTPNWFSYFYGNRPLSVETSDTRLHIIGQRNYGEKGQNAGGDGELAMDSSMSANKEAINMDIFSFRKNFLSTAFYKGQLKTDSNGMASVSFNLPDNLTSFRIMATAVDKGEYFGANDDIIVVKKNLMVSETIPEFAMIDDEFYAGATVYNYSGKDLKVTIAAEGKNIDIENPEKVVTIKGGSFEDVRFKFKANNKGVANIKIAAKGGEFTDGIEKNIIVKTPRTTEAVALFGSTTEDEINQKIIIPNTNEVYQDTGDIMGYLSPSAFSELTGGLDYLIQYPYGCLEQKMSKIYPIVTSKKLIIDMKLTEYTEEYLDSLVKTVLVDAKNYQNSNGGFSYWTSKTWVSPWLTTYATFVLLKAKENGYDVEQSVIDKALKYLSEQAKGKYSTTPLYTADYINTSNLAFTASLLAMGGKADKQLIARLYKERNLMPFYALANLLEAMAYANYDKKSMDDIHTMMLNTLKEDATTAHYETDPEYEELYWIHSSSVRDTSVGLISLLKADYDDDLNDKIIRWLTQSQKGGRYNNTQENVYAFYAMNEYFKKYENIDPKYKAEIMVAGKSLLEHTFNSRNDDSVTASKPLDNFYPRGEETDISIKRDGEGRLYYGLRMTYAPREMNKARNNGIEVERTFTTMDGEKIEDNKFIQGQSYKVQVKVTMPYERRFVILDSPIAAGFSILNATFATESSEVAEATGGNRGFGSFNHTENYLDRVILFGDVMRKGVHTFTYVVRATTPGEYLLPSTKSEEMYNPDVFGYDEQSKIEIIEKR